MKRLAPTLFALALLAACGSTSTNPVTGQKERTVMNEQTELSEGRKAHEEVLKEYGAYPNQALQNYVSNVGLRLAKASQRPNLPWTFTVLDSPEVNAFALPGGYIYITRGIMAYLDSEADLAGVLGHEIGHVTARHGAQRATRQQNAGLGVLAATVLGAVLEAKGVSGATEAVGQVSQGVAAGYIASYSRDQELQADQLGAEYLARNQYDPKNMVDVIRVLKNQELFAEQVARAEGRAPRQSPGWLSSHPSSDRRLQEIADIAAKNAQLAGGRFADDGRARYLQAINGMVFGETREQGVTRGRNFFHELLGFAITAPAGWKVQNGADTLTLVNGQGDAGLIMRLLPPDAGTDHNRILRDGLKAERGNVERLTLGGTYPATHFVGTRTVQQGQQQSQQNIAVTVATGPGNRAFLFQYAGADANAINRNRSAFREAELSFRPLSQADRNAARPWSLRTVQFPRGGYPQLARSTPLTEFAEQQLRLLNASFVQGDPPVGALVKVIE
jgi:predicted Zn-dependent protease